MADKAAQAPKDRAAWVEQSFRDSKLQTDPAAKAWGLQIQPNMSLVLPWSQKPYMTDDEIMQGSRVRGLGFEVPRVLQFCNWGSAVPGGLIDSA